VNIPHIDLQTSPLAGFGNKSRCLTFVPVYAGYLDKSLRELDDLLVVEMRQQ
jgi:hypothetical protein